MQAEALIAYIKNSLPHFDLLGPPESLRGGLLNYVWRMPAKPHSFIAKYTPPFIASAPQIAMDAARTKFEANALRWWGEQTSLNDSIRPPHLLYADGERSLILMEDIGPVPDLGESLKNSSLEEASFMGQQIGNFLAQLHRSTFQDQGLAKRFQNTGVLSVRLAVQYNLLPSLERAGIPQAKEMADQISILGQWISQPGVCLIMGDLWPASILVSQTGLRIIDWEFAHFGWPVQDVAHLVAHLWMQADRASTQEHVMAVQSCLDSFLEAYFTGFAERLATGEAKRLYFVHMGAEILARTIGDFQAGYLYDGLLHDDPLIQRAVNFASQCILSPATDSYFGPFFVI